MIPLTIVSREKGPDLTCLYCASARAPVRIIKALIDQGAPIPMTDSLGPIQPILFQVANFEVMRLLVDHGADVLAVDRWKRNLLQWFGGSNVEIAKFLLDRGVKLIDRDYQGRVPLFSAIRTIDTTVAEFMLERGADINAVDNDGANALFYAATPPNLASMSFFLKRGLDSKSKNKKNETPIHAALSFFNDVRSERVQVTHLLLQNGANVNAQDFKGAAGLHIAASRLDKPAIEVLLKHGADPNLTDRSGRTPLHLAAGIKVHPQRPTVSGAPQSPGVDDAFVAEQLSRKHDAIRMLLRHGANKAVKDASNLRPFDLLGDSLESTTKRLLE